MFKISDNINSSARIIENKSTTQLKTNIKFPSYFCQENFGHVFSVFENASLILF